MNVFAKANRMGKIWARASAIAGFGLLLATCFGVSAFSTQVAPTNKTDADLQPFVGTWQAKFKGKTFLTINLEKQQGKLTGTISHGAIQLDKAGELTSAKKLDGSEVFMEAKPTNGILRIAAKIQNSLEGEMKLTGSDQAELQMHFGSGFIFEPNVTAPKPLKLERAFTK